jgi:hypothetical protein
VPSERTDVWKWVATTAVGALAAGILMLIREDWTHAPMKEQLTANTESVKVLAAEINDLRELLDSFEITREDRDRLIREERERIRRDGR